jgi:hypothetical protein
VVDRVSAVARDPLRIPSRTTATGTGHGATVFPVTPAPLRPPLAPPDPPPGELARLGHPIAASPVREILHAADIAADIAAAPDPDPAPAPAPPHAAPGPAAGSSPAARAEGVVAADLGTRVGAVPERMSVRGPGLRRLRRVDRLQDRVQQAGEARVEVLAAE